jgi:hypothetical protein
MGFPFCKDIIYLTIFIYFISLSNINKLILINQINIKNEKNFLLSYFVYGVFFL